MSFMYFKKLILEYISLRGVPKILSLIAHFGMYVMYSEISISKILF